MGRVAITPSTASRTTWCQNLILSLRELPGRNSGQNFHYGESSAIQAWADPEARLRHRPRAHGIRGTAQRHAAFVLFRGSLDSAGRRSAPASSARDDMSGRALARRDMSRGSIRLQRPLGRTSVFRSTRLRKRPLWRARLPVRPTVGLRATPALCLRISVVLFLRVFVSSCLSSWGLGVLVVRSPSPSAELTSPWRSCTLPCRHGPSRRR
jgi:hypothetical protein